MPDGVHAPAAGAAGDGRAPAALHKDAFIYATDFDPDDLNDAHALVLRMTGEGRRVLELGCAEGSTTRLLRARGCQVVGIELDEAAAAVASTFAEKVIIGDLDSIDFGEALGDDTFDVIIAADVLEHLKDPIRCVVGSRRHLRPGGEYVLSIPNVAHADVRLALADGHFDYGEWGLLDDTHLRFFTRSSLLDFLERCGLAEVELQRVIRPMGTTELAPPMDRFPELVDHLSRDPEAETYQFVLRAASVSDDPHLAEVARQRELWRREADQLRDLEIYRAAHRRLLHLLCPDVLDADVVGPCGSPAREKVHMVEAAVRRLLEQHDALSREIERLQDAVEIEQAEHRAAAQARDRLHEEIEEFRRSETYRVGRAVLGPAMAARRSGSRVVRAWRQSGGDR